MSSKKSVRTVFSVRIEPMPQLAVGLTVDARWGRTSNTAEHDLTLEGPENDEAELD